MNNGVYGKKMENSVDVRLIHNKKNYWKWTSKSIYVAKKIFEKNLLAIHKIKNILTQSKPACGGICTPPQNFDYIKVLIDTDDKLPDDITLKNVVILITCVSKDDDEFYMQLLLEQALYNKQTWK